MSAYDQLMAFQRETEALGEVAGRLGWDQETMMPKAAADQRSEGHDHERHVTPNASAPQHRQRDDHNARLDNDDLAFLEQNRLRGHTCSSMARSRNSDFV